MGPPLWCHHTGSGVARTDWSFCPQTAYDPSHRRGFPVGADTHVCYTQVDPALSPMGSASRLGVGERHWVRGPDCGAALGTVSIRHPAAYPASRSHPKWHMGPTCVPRRQGHTKGREAPLRHLQRPLCPGLALSPGRAWPQAGSPPEDMVCHETPPSFIPVHVLPVCGVPMPLPRVPGPVSSCLSGGRPQPPPPAQAPPAATSGRPQEPSPRAPVGVDNGVRPSGPGGSLQGERSTQAGAHPSQP